MNGIRSLAAIVAASLLWVWPAVAPAQETHPVPASPPLKPGRSAGVHVAQQARTGVALIGTGAIIAVVIVAATASGNGSGSSNNPVNPQFTTVTTAP
jgi:hypothetical protein